MGRETNIKKLYHEESFPALGSMTFIPAVKFPDRMILLNVQPVKKPFYGQ
jgi:hypothetical protein